MHLPLQSDPLNPFSPIANLSLCSAAPHRILIVGGAYAGISAVLNLLDLSEGKQRPSTYPLPDFGGAKSKRGVSITVIDERDGFFHPVGAPLAHVSKTYTSVMWKRYNLLKELSHACLKFKHGSVKKIDPETCVTEYVDRNGDTHMHPYDFLVLATGLRRHWPAVPKSESHRDYLRDAKALIEKITGGVKDATGRRVVVIGAGAVGIEFAGEVKNNHPSLSVTLVHSRTEVLSSEPLPTEFKQRAKLVLKEEGVELILNNRASVEDLPEGKYKVTLADGTEIIADAVLDTTKKGYPTTNCLPPSCLDDEREVKVTPHLTFQSTIKNFERHFAAGDVVAWSGIKRAGGAMVMGQVAATNLYAEILKQEDPSAGIKQGELPEYPVVMGLAIGKQCVTYDNNGIKWGEDVMKLYFQDDLGWKASLKYLGLTDIEEKQEVKKPAQVVVAEIVRKIEVDPVAVAAA
ncbi:FAD/NAD(P)-binding domain-containing protein [Delitschia confertaspora ATCC 74209]|uniref:FAD/NAD(P)-binding domain-containing protein n=1 Tax=Delitschia confertaspora ATCC 74209 TaxID=1513339 RepID=A0A9P4JEU5_9PLEO|nr:FAD/NAD(P)-binding domain-containing protein [Delitschia confertaspora ATCC 74209]